MTIGTRLICTLLAALAGACLTGADAPAAGPTARYAPGQEISVLDFMTAAQIAAVRSRTCDSAVNIGSISIDVRDAVQAAIDALGGRAGTINFPSGCYLFKSGITVSNHRQHLRGSGQWATQLVFAPSANGTLITYRHSSAAPIYQFSVRDMSLYSHDSRFTKTALEIVDGSTYQVERVTIGGTVAIPNGQGWAGRNSIGIRVRGREMGDYRAIDIAANRPILISDNPNTSIDIDHHRFRSLYLLGDTANPLIQIESGVNLTTTSFADMALVQGSSGFLWNDTTSTQISQDLVIGQHRCEGQAAGGYCVDIKHYYGLYNIAISDGTAGGATRNGWRVQATCRNLTLRNLFYSVGTNTGVSVNCRGVTLESINLNDGAAALAINNSTYVTGTVTQGGNINAYVQEQNLVWTPVDNSGASLGFSNVEARYTRVGDMVFAYGRVDYPVTASRTHASIGGLPYRVRNNKLARGSCQVTSNAGNYFLLPDANGFTASFLDGGLAPAANASLSGKIVIFNCSYPAAQ